LDHPLEERNTIEMQAITALAHLKAAVLYIMDPSEQCDHSIQDQLNLFENIKPLFQNKPLVVVCNKTDVLKMSELSEEKRALFKPLEYEGIPILEMSTVTEEGLMNVKEVTCERLLEHRVQNKMKKKEISNVVNRLHVAVPQERDQISRPPFIPQEVIDKKNKMMEEDDDDEDRPKRKLEKDLMEEMREDYFLDLKKHYLLKNDEWKYDKIPEFHLGKNIADFIDVNMKEKLQKLIVEERLREEAGAYESDSSDDEFVKETHATAEKIRDKLGIARDQSLGSKPNHKVFMPRPTRARERFRTTGKLRSQLSELGVDMAGTEDAHFTRTKKRERSASEGPRVKRARSDVHETSRSRSRPPRDQSGVRDQEMAEKLVKIKSKAMKPFAQDARLGESDRHIYDKKPKHLFSGKMQAGKKTRR